MKATTTMPGMQYLGTKETEYQGKRNLRVIFWDEKEKDVLKAKTEVMPNLKKNDVYNINVKFSDYTMNGKTGISIQYLGIAEGK